MKRDIHSETTFDLDHDGLAHEFLEAALLPFYAIAPGQNVDKRVFSRGTRLHVVLFRGPEVRQCDRRVGNCGSACVCNVAGDGPINVLRPRSLKREG